MNSGFGSSGTIDVHDPEAFIIPPIPPCETKNYIQLPCYDFAWSGNQSPRIQSIVEKIMLNNPGRPIPPHKVKSFNTTDEVNAWLYSEPMHCAGALHFIDKSATVISYEIQTNNTSAKIRGEDENPLFKFQLPFQIAAEREIASGMKEFAHPANKYISAFDAAGSVFLLAMFPFISHMSSLVAEKELKLRQAMSIMGLYESVYWLSWLVRDTVIICISSLLIVAVGVMSQFDFFVHNGFVVLFLDFFLFRFSMIGFAFALSTLLSKTSSANAIGFFVFIISYLAGGLMSGDILNMLPTKYRILWNFFPPNVFDKIVEDDAFKWFVGNFVLWFLLALYLDNVIPNSSCVISLFFLEPALLDWKHCTGEVPLLDEKNPDDEDVLEEKRMVKDQMNDMTQHLLAYPGTFKLKRCGGGCCTLTRTSTYHAVKGVWMNFQKDQLLCLLGPNGAGKTTLINCLIGNIPVTGGDALIYGNSDRSSVGMTNIRRLIGVCPQFDIIWAELSCQEHLQLFGSIKDLPLSSLDSSVKELLAKVKLADAARVRAASCSGGMKHRLSVACSLVGDPKLVILDEPTTGMDPVTRRHVWDVIEDEKKGRSIILTTHSMEEAGILGDHIAIVAKGKLRCIGTSIRLKSRFWTGLIAMVSFAGSTSRQTPGNGDAITDPHHQAVKQFFMHHLDVVPKEETKSFLTYVIPHEHEEFLSYEFGIADIQLGLTTLEEVFLNIAKKAELENASTEGNLVTITLTSGQTPRVKTLHIPKGANYVGIPKTESEENPRGLLVEYPVPPHAKIVASTAKSSENPQLGKPEVGIIYDQLEPCLPICFFFFFLWT
ncbi:hypothetical protein MKX01_024305 [Papaver californicum]|nr:hypothetical protein MKX01_024305 [Papaver californicum]